MAKYTLQKFDPASQWDALFLGNGASIAVSPQFRYQSLLERAVATSPAWNQDVADLFAALKTSHFEQVLQVLGHGRFLDRVLGRKRVCQTLYERVRRVLIEAIAHNHCSHAEAKPKLAAAARFLRRFPTIATVNYDLIPYWASLKGGKSQWFRDWFSRHGQFEYRWQSMADGRTCCFFPHGNLSLISDRDGKERKLRRQKNRSLMQTVFNAWQTRQTVPLIITEGTSDDKRAAIARSPYLSHVFHQVLPRLGKRVLVYGFSFSDHDEHLLHAMAQGQIETLGISVYGSPGSVCPGVQAKVDKAFAGKVAIQWLDVRSPGLWISK